MAMKKNLFLWFFILIAFVGLSESTDSLEHQINSLSELNRAYSKALQNLIDHTGLFKSGSEYLVLPMTCPSYKLESVYL